MDPPVGVQGQEVFAVQLGQHVHSRTACRGRGGGEVDRFGRDTQAAGLTLAEICSVLALRDSGQAPCARVGVLIEEHLAEIDRRMTELRQARTVLREPARRAAVTSPDTCSAGDICILLTRP